MLGQLFCRLKFSETFLYWVGLLMRNIKQSYNSANPQGINPNSPQGLLTRDITWCLSTCLE